MARRQQGNAAGIAVGVRHQAVQRVLPQLGEMLQRRDELGGEHFRQDAAEAAAVLQRMCQAVGTAGAVGQHAPFPVRPAHEVGGIKLKQTVGWLGRRVAA